VRGVVDRHEVGDKRNARRWVLNDEDSREWSTAIKCRRGPSSDGTIDFDEVGSVSVLR
jgi:hypothetical protein